MVWARSRYQSLLSMPVAENLEALAVSNEYHVLGEQCGFCYATAHDACQLSRCKSKGKGGKRESPREGGGSLGEPAEGPTIADLQRCWGSHEQSYQGVIQDLGTSK